MRSELAVFVPKLNEITGVALISGRQGFHSAEASGFAWLRADMRARIYFRAIAAEMCVRLRFYTITDDYRIDQIAVLVNGNEVSATAAWDGDSWCVVDAGPFVGDQEVNEIAIDPPGFFSVRLNDPKTRDERYLSVALSSVMFSLPPQADGEEPDVEGKAL